MDTAEDLRFCRTLLLVLKRTYPLVRVFAAESIYNKLLIGCFPWIDTSSRSQLELILSTTPW